MPTFVWNLDPEAFHVPRLIVVAALALAAVSLLAQGLKSKAAEATLFGVVLAGVSAVVWKMAPEAIPVRYYSLIFVAVFLGGYGFLNWQIRRGGGREEVAGDFIVYGVLGVLIGARLGHVLFYDLEKAMEDPLWIFKIWTGGLASHGATIGLVIAMYLFTKRRGVSFIEGSDRFTFSAALGATLVRLGNFFNSEIVGRPTDQSWGVSFPRLNEGGDVLRHPTQLYEVGLGIFTLGALWAFDRILGREKRPRGALVSLFFLLYFSGRFAVEFFKEYQILDPESSPLTMGQYLSIPGIALGIYGLWWSFKKRLPAGWDEPDDGLEDSEESLEGEADNDDEEDDEADLDDDRDGEPNDDGTDDEDEGEDEDEDGDGDGDEDDSEESARGGADEEPKKATGRRTSTTTKEQGRRSSAKSGSPEKTRPLEADPDVDDEFGGTEEERRRRARQARHDAGGDPSRED